MKKVMQNLGKALSATLSAVYTGAFFNGLIKHSTVEQKDLEDALAYIQYLNRNPLYIAKAKECIQKAQVFYTTVPEPYPGNYCVARLFTDLVKEDVPLADINEVFEKRLKGVYA